MKLFSIPTECEDDDQQYFYDFFYKQLNILDCKMKDLYIGGQLLNPGQLNKNLAQAVLRALVNLTNKIPLAISNSIRDSQQKTVVILPLQTINFKGMDYKLGQMDAKAIYSKLIYPKVKMPRGLLNWCMDLELSDSQIKNSLRFAHQCCTNIFECK